MVGERGLEARAQAGLVVGAGLWPAEGLAGEKGAECEAALTRWLKLDGCVAFGWLLNLSVPPLPHL